MATLDEKIKALAEFMEVDESQVEYKGSSPDNPDRQKLIAKISGIINNTIKYYENYILSIDKTEEEIATIRPLIDAEIAKAGGVCKVSAP